MSKGWKLVLKTYIGGIKENEGVKNIGKDCLNKGDCGNWGYGIGHKRGGQGPCNYCGPEGYCCRKENSGWWDKTSGCDGTFGGERGHQCAARTGIIFVVLSYLYLLWFYTLKDRKD